MAFERTDLTHILENLEENRSSLNCNLLSNNLHAYTFYGKNIFKRNLTSFECNLLFNNFQLNYANIFIKESLNEISCSTIFM